MNADPDDLAGLRDEIDGVGRSAAKRFDPGTGALTIAVAVLAILVSMVLPWVDGDTGLRVLLGEASAMPKFFSYASLLAGVLLPAITLATRRWALAWTCALASFAASVSGVLSIWMTQTTTGHHPGPGPGAGLILAVVAIVVLLVKWLRIAASRAGMQ
ncbi:Rv2732c family membrane protein [Actinosynnema sp. CS-041913]|uniref:Rv2732c family membrane protein n=1 Tax=Actinosynnema sp. CS-041913 TaxID=3239917 RepID=UPI003D8B6447